MTVHFIGAGPGAADLLTIRAARLISGSPVCLYAGTYIGADVLSHCPPDASLVDTQHLDLDAIVAACVEAHEAGEHARIVMKMNSLVDRRCIRALYEAAQAGVRIDLNVRGICCLRAGVPGVSENIRVVSVVGRFLEHSRVYRFGADPAHAEYLIGSADLMPRNLDRRVEALTPITDDRLKSRLAEMLAIELADDVLAWELRTDGTWHKVPTVEGIDTHERLAELAVRRGGEGRDART